MRSDVIKKGVERAPHRALLKATGISEDELDKPFVAVCNSYTDIIPGHVHLGRVGNFVKDCIRKAGGTPFVFNTIGVDDGIAMGHSGMKYSLPSRELIADSVETMLRAHCFDAMICIPNCDKIVPGMLMAAMRVNIPTIFVSGGPMEAGRMPDGSAVDLISIFKGIGRFQAGEIDEAELKTLEDCGCPTCGSCSGMFTANSMNCLSEALGMALPGNGTLLATSEARGRLYEMAAHQLMVLLEKQLLPRNICTAAAFDNAMILDMAMGGSTNTVLHTLAIAREAGVDYKMSRIDELSRQTPNICKVSPSSNYHMEDVHRAGGVHTILGELLRHRPGLLHEACLTATGATLGENVRAWDIRAESPLPLARELATVGPSATRGALAMSVKKSDQETIAPDFTPLDCIRTPDNAYAQEGGLSILYGNLAEEGCVVKTAGVDERMMVHEGPAVIFEEQEAACEGILGGKVKAGDVVVIRYEGPRGGPGMQEMLSPTSYLQGLGLGDKCALITDGRFSGGTSGACIGHISPEAAEGGTIALLRDGDIIAIDIPNRLLHVKLTAEELAERRAAWKAPEPRMSYGWLGRYQKAVTNAAEGAVLK